MDPYYAWTAPVPGSDRVTIIAAVVTELGPTPIPLLAQQEQVVDTLFRPFAELHAERNPGEPVRKMKLVVDPDFNGETL